MKKNEILELSKRKMLSFYNKYQNQRCVIIGNGPSLNKMDLSFLRNEYTFGMNKIYLGFDRFDFYPSFYVAVNQLVLEQSCKEIENLKCPKFLSHHGIPYFNDDFYKRTDTMFIQSIIDEKFSNNPLNGLWEGCTVTFVAMQLAYFMGFKEVYLIGVDHNFKAEGKPHEAVTATGDDINHFDTSYFGKGLSWHLPDLENSERAYSLAKEAFSADNRKIIDITFEGKLKVFPKMDYRDIFLNKSIPIREKRQENEKNALNHVKDSWTYFGKDDPFWAVLTVPEKKGNKWDPDDFYKHGRNSIRRILNQLMELNVELEFSSALDFGCGPGRLTQALALFFEQVYGVDISLPMLETALKYNKFGNKCQYIQNTVDNLNIFPDNTLNFIITLITLQHMKPLFIKNYLCDFVRVLKPKGILTFQLPGKRLDMTEEQWLEFRSEMDSKKNLSNKPVMEMNGIDKDEVLGLMKSLNCKIIQHFDDRSLQPHWESNYYIVQKIK